MVMGTGTATGTGTGTRSHPCLDLVTTDPDLVMDLGMGTAIEVALGIAVVMLRGTLVDLVTATHHRELSIKIQTQCIYIFLLCIYVRIVWV